MNIVSQLVLKGIERKVGKKSVAANNQYRKHVIQQKAGPISSPVANSTVLFL